MTRKCFLVISILVISTSLSLPAVTGLKKRPSRKIRSVLEDGGQPFSPTSLSPFTGGNHRGSCVCYVNCPASDDSQDEAIEELSNKIDRLENILLSLVRGIGDPDSLPDDSLSVLPPRDCQEILDRGVRTSGVYTVYFGCSMGPYQVYCDMETGGGGWTVFQRRQDGKENFYRTWGQYQVGFGNLTGEFWLGNQAIYLATAAKPTVLRIDMGDEDGIYKYAMYDNFVLGSEAEGFKLTVGHYSGTAGDSLSYHNGQPFSAKDKDLDARSTHCAQSHQGAWWYKGCHSSNLNGVYGASGPGSKGVNWRTWKGNSQYSLTFSEMKMRPHDF